jgi:ATP-dependent phosphofructokinase / diphosphate-dependent phosphofructokinase
MAKRIGILTGGGDVPGLNSVIKGVVYHGAAAGYETIGIRRGWEGLTFLNMDDPGSRALYINPLDRDEVRSIDRTGGTYLHTSRLHPQAIKTLPEFLAHKKFPSYERTRHGVTQTVFDLSSHVLKNLQALGIDYLVAIGGDGTLSYTAKLREMGVKIIAIPKTMDNDVQNTEYCIGFSTAITRAMDAINRQRSTLGSHERVGVFRVFGRDSGYTALYTAYVTSCRCAIPEHPFSKDKMIELLLGDKRNNPSNYSVVILSEAASWDGYEPQYIGPIEHRRRLSVGEVFANVFETETGQNTIVSDLTYDLRSGEADFLDKMVAATFAGMAVDCIAQDRSGVMTAIVDGRYALADLPDPKLGPRTIHIPTMYNTERYRPTYNHKLGLPIMLNRTQELPGRALIEKDPLQL